MTENGVSLADIAAVTDRNGYGYGNDFGGSWMMWIFALLILPMITGGGFFGNNGRGNPVTEADLCQSQSFAELKGSVGRGFDQQTQFAFQNQRDLCTSIATLSSQIAAAAAAQERCCCETKSLIQQTQYEAAQNTAAINANTTAQAQKILDYLCNQDNMRLRDENMRNYINSMFCGVPRFNPGTVYGSIPVNPFFGNSCCNNCNNGFGNI